MRTPGHDFELAAGFLFTEGISTTPHQIREDPLVSDANGNPGQLGNSVTVELNPGVEVDLDRLERHFYTTSSCGVCGKASIEAIQMQGCPVLPRNSPLVESGVIHRLPETLRREQAGLRTHRRPARRGALLARRERSSCCAKTWAATTPSTN
jgi:FdhD protein